MLASLNSFSIDKTHFFVDILSVKETGVEHEQCGLGWKQSAWQRGLCKGHGEDLSCSGEPHAPMAEQTCAGVRALSLFVSPLGNLEKIAPVIRPPTA